VAVDRLARRTLSVALAHAQHGRFEAELGPEIGTPQGGITWPQAIWTGWKASTSLIQVLQLGRGAASPFTMRPSGNTRSPQRLYRVWMAGEAAPLYIGMAFSKTVAERLADHIKDAVRGLAAAAAKHLRPTQQLMDKTARDRVRRYADKQLFRPEVYAESRSESERLRLILVREEAKGRLGQVRVAYGDIVPEGRTRLDPKTLHIFELALWVQEHPKTYLSYQRAFEDEP
jgi:hypothetical protein